MTNLGHALTLALLHFVWQGAAVALLLWMALGALRNRSADARYAACGAAMAAMLMLPAITAWTMRAAPPAAVTDGFAFPAPAVPDGASAAALARVAPAPSTNWLAMAQSWVLPLWAIGVAVFAVRMAWGCGQVARLRRGGSAADAGLLEAARRLAQRVGLARAAQVLVSDGVAGPSVVGWLRPVILLPACAISGLSAEQLEAVLAHELAHIRRYDALVNLAQMAVETVLFYHPAVWWVSRRMRLERELCCDDLAVRACEDALCYARALTVLERLRMGSMTAAPGAVDRSLRYRIERIAGVGRQEYGASRGAGVLAAALALAGLAIGLHSARAQQQPGIDNLRQGDLLLKDKRYAEAIGVYTAGEQQNPDQKMTYQKRIIEALMRQGRRAEAADIGEQILKEHPGDTDTLGLRAALLVDAGKIPEALAALQSLVKLVPANPVIHYNLGRAYAAEKQYDAAASELKTAIKMRPDYNMAVMAYAILLIEQNHYGGTPSSMAEARRMLQPLQESGPASVDVWMVLAALDKGLGDFERASEDYLKAYELQPGNEQWLHSAAIALIDAKQPERALELVRAEAQKHPERLDLAMGLGEVALRIGQTDLAVESYRKMTSSGNAQAEAAGYWQLALLYSSKNDWRNALESIDETIKIQPWNQDAKKLRERIERQEKTPKK
jgi:beta-lactamase regulating signal transducer with metallopeptidase domain/Tfp pilus assembly protein PilF